VVSVEFDGRYVPGRGHKLEYSIASDSLNVLPRLSRWDTVCCLKRLEPDELASALRYKVFPQVWSPQPVMYAVCGENARRFAAERNLDCISQVEPEIFHAAVSFLHGETLLKNATDGLRLTRPLDSAYRRMTPGQVAMALVLASATAFGLLLAPSLTLTVIAWIVGLFFMLVVCLRALALLASKSDRGDFQLAESTSGDLPIYTVLVPLFRETAVLDDLIPHLKDLRYPPSKLDIKLILEEGDKPMRHAVSQLSLPPQFEVIVVPKGHPQTKPRALNYALQFASGELLTIYDAEDEPEPDQLLKAHAVFAREGPALACLQARLMFENADDNWLTRQFTIEYAILFDLLLPELASQGLPLPLGGTSNHFRTDVLRNIGGWDAWNVTEDADLGFRLARAGYLTGTIDSYTLEEANCKTANWLRQRARWLKGFLHTWLVHMRQPRRLYAQLGASGMWTFQAYTAGVFVSALLHPIFLALSAWLLVTGRAISPGMGWMQTSLAILSVAIFVAGYGVSIAAGYRALRRQRVKGWWLTLLTMPFYWGLMMVAAWMALWQFITAPHHWNKTEHGISKRRRLPAESRDPFARYSAGVGEPDWLV
jgi:cellulose synthase/poly-beta-1,6-N-acetylglucosamine synthase-like glycosyltransferase